MAKGIYMGVDGKARKVKNIYIGVDGKARKVKKAWIGVDGKARLVFSDNPGVLIVMTNRGVLYRSTNQGTTWTQNTALSSRGTVLDLSDFFWDDDGRFYIAYKMRPNESTDGLAYCYCSHSDDGGITWDHAQLPTSANFSIGEVFALGNTVIVFGNHGVVNPARIYRSTNRGASFSLQQTGGPVMNRFTYNSDKKQLVAFRYVYNLQWYSNDLGATWTKGTTSLDFTSGQNIMDMAYGNGYYVIVNSENEDEYRQIAYSTSSATAFTRYEPRKIGRAHV